MIPDLTFQRLPQYVVPEHYELQFTPDLQSFLFEGKSTIKVKINACTDKVTLNSVNLAIKRVEYESELGGKHVPSDISMSMLDETITISFPEPIPIGSGEFTFQFTGELSDKLRGWYRSKYISVDGLRRYAAVTKFEPTDARRCFPCWDEPAMKATFSITLVIPENRTALTNMPIESVGPDPDHPGLKITRFEKSPPMSPFLVSMVVGEYEYLEDKSSDGVICRVYTPIGLKQHGKFALYVATKVLPYYKEYFQISYPLPKLDLIAIHEFAAGAMGCWGLITYQESCLLVHPQEATEERKQWTALVVGHELAHQWFGNLVTMEWWTDLWLNEGYASYVEFLCISHLFPEYDIWRLFISVYSRAMELDWLKDSHPLEVPVGSPAEIEDIFDDISFNKGACMIRMLHDYVGDEDFRKGMNVYFSRHQYKSTMTDDLWAAVEEASDKPVGKVMRSWTRQQGFPVVKVKSDQNGTTRTLTLTQERFCANSPPDESLWLVPINICSSQNPSKPVFSLVLEERTKEIVLTDIAEDDWVKLNPGTVGFYRSLYPPHMLEQFAPAIREKSMPPHDRLGLLDDMFALVQSGQASTVDGLKLLEAFNDEDNCSVWSGINGCLAKLSWLLAHTDFEEMFNAYGRRLMGGIGERLGWEPQANECHLDALVRSFVIGRRAWFEDPDVITEAQKRFAAHESGDVVIPKDLKSALYEAVLTGGDESTVNTMLRMYRESDNDDEKGTIARSLGAVRDVELLRKILEFSISDEVRLHDTVFIVISVGMSKRGREMAWDFLRNKWGLFCERYHGGFLLTRLIQCTTQNFASEWRAKEVTEFFERNPAPGAEMTIQHSVESIRQNAAWLRHDLDETREFLSAYK